MAAKTGDRKSHILATLADMLEQPRAARITTAALAARMQVSEAALYRHFASKAQMFDGLIVAIETTLFGLIGEIAAGPRHGVAQAREIAATLLAFAERHRGMTRVLTGDALVTEDDRLHDRINHIHDRLEAALCEALRTGRVDGSLPSQVDVEAQASVLVHVVLGRWLRYAQSGWKRPPTTGLDEQLALLLPAAR